MTTIDIDVLMNIIHIVKADRKNQFSTFKYMVNQTIRLYNFPKEHYYVSNKAKELWDKLTDDDIFNYVYRDAIIVKQDIDLPQYVGSAKLPKEVKHFNKGDKVLFRTVFHDEHIIPVQTIVNEIYTLSDDELTPENVEKILLKTTICKILKEEDRRLPHKRLSTFKENYEQIYKPNDVYLIEKE